MVVPRPRPRPLPRPLPRPPSAPRPRPTPLADMLQATSCAEDALCPQPLVVESLPRRRRQPNALHGGGACRAKFECGEAVEFTASRARLCNQTTASTLKFLTAEGEG